MGTPTDVDLTEVATGKQAEEQQPQPEIPTTANEEEGE